jgi:hypothetical protein
MSVRVRSLLAAFLLTTACSSQTNGGPVEEARAPGPVSVAPSAGKATVPADRWRAVLVAGDNSSPAFDNGVEALQSKLASHGVRDIRVLTSDPEANPSLPVATAANVSSALRAGGGEACFAFITSHGDERGVALRAARGYVSPSALTSALDAGCGQKPTVVIVSACHSGIFLTDAMRRPNRIVLSAAASDRVSFGCGTGDQYTYYDQCLLQSFDGAATWRQLAGATRGCVERLERSMGVPRPSQPQIFVGAAVNDLRIPGR